MGRPRQLRDDRDLLSGRIRGVDGMGSAPMDRLRTHSAADRWTERALVKRNAHMRNCVNVLHQNRPLFAPRLRSQFFSLAMTSEPGGHRRDQMLAKLTEERLAAAQACTKRAYFWFDGTICFVTRGIGIAQMRRISRPVSGAGQSARCGADAARKAKNFTEPTASGRARAMGVVLKDSKDGTTWEVAR